MVGVACGACVQVLMLIVALLSPSTQPVARAVEPVHARGCVSTRLSVDVPEAGDVPEHEPLPARPHAMSVLGAVKGSEFKFSLYRGVGGGLRVVTTDEGVALTFEVGFGMGGSFSAGTADRLPAPGAVAEGRVSLRARVLPVAPPDFGVTLDPDGRLQGYTDVKAGKVRTRFYSEPLHLMGDPEDAEEAEGTDAPVVRRSWSLGSELKIATKYTFRSTWKAIADMFVRLAGSLPSAHPFQVSPSRPAEPDLLRVILVQDRSDEALGASPCGEACCAGPAPAYAESPGLLTWRRPPQARSPSGSPV